MSEPELVLAAVDEEYWFVSGDDGHLDLMLRGEPGYPVPVGCIHFPSKAAFEAELGVPLKEASLWQIHPAIVARLKAEDQLLEITVAED